MRLNNLSKILISSTFMASFIMVSENSYGTEHQMMEAMRKKQQAAVAPVQQRLGAVTTAHAGWQTFIGHLRAPTTIMQDANALGIALRQASADGGSAAHNIIPAAALPNQFYKDKLHALRKVEEAPVGGADDQHKEAIRTALGLEADLAHAHAAVVNNAVEQYIKTLENNILIEACNTRRALIPGPINPIIAAAVADGGSVANPLPNLNWNDKAAIVDALAGSAHAPDHAKFTEIMTILGLSDVRPMSAETRARMMQGFFNHP